MKQLLLGLKHKKLLVVKHFSSHFHDPWPLQPFSRELLHLLEFVFTFWNSRIHVFKKILSTILDDSHFKSNKLSVVGRSLSSSSLIKMPFLLFSENGGPIINSEMR